MAFSGKLLSSPLVASQNGVFWLVCVFAIDYKSVWHILASLCLRRRLEVTVAFSG